DATGDQRGDPPQSRLLRGQRPEVRRFLNPLLIHPTQPCLFSITPYFSGPRLAGYRAHVLGANAQYHCAAAALLSQPTANLALFLAADEPQAHVVTRTSARGWAGRLYLARQRIFRLVGIVEPPRRNAD